jgi:dipeptidyl aminopeptidase/acylaminoacyl peptidase
MAAALCIGNVHAEQTPIEAFTQHAQYSEAKISPNGKYLAMTVDEQGQNLLVVLNLGDMAIVHTVKMADEKSVAEFAWAGPERLVFNAARNVGSYAQPFLTGEWFAVNADGSQGRTLLAYNVGGGSIGQTKQISYTDGYSLLHPLPEDPGQILMTVSSAASTQVVSVDTMSGQRRVLAKIAKGGCSFALDVSHQPNMAVCSDDRGENGAYEINSQLYRVDGVGHWNLMSDSKTSGERIVVLDSAPDGRVYAIADDRKLPAAFGLLDVSTGQFKKLYQDPVSDPARFIVGSDGHTILAVVTAAGVPHIEMVDANSPDTRLYASLANSFPGQLVDFTSATQDGKKIVVSVKSDRNPGELYLYDRDSGQARFLIRNRMALDPRQMASVRAFSFKTRDGLTEYGYLTIPHGSNGKNLPLIVNPHGGPMGPRDDWEFNWETQLLASRGYMVLQVNYRGSGGFGQAFQDKSYGQWAQGLMNDIIDATHWAIDQGYADRERNCIYGGSFGGYASLMAPAREPGLFKCAFGYVGLYDAQIQLSRSDTSKRDSGRRYLVRAFGNTRAEQDAMSPINYVDKLKLPIYLAAGARDPRCPPEHTEAMRDALTRAGNPPEGVIIQPGEMHGYYKDDAKLNLYTKMLDFFGRHIGGSAEVGAPSSTQ